MPFTRRSSDANRPLCSEGFLFFFLVLFFLFYISFYACPAPTSSWSFFIFADGPIHELAVVNLFSTKMYRYRTCRGIQFTREDNLGKVCVAATTYGPKTMVEGPDVESC